jgi:NADH-quinone oxidoreductase subunit F
MLNLLDDIIEGNATDETLALLEQLAKAVQKGSLCGLGKTAPNPVLSTLKYFRAEYEAHVRDKHCQTGQCKALAKFSIDAVLCKGCTLCSRKCPVTAISGEKGSAHQIDQKTCIKCGACVSTCKFKAISGGIR